MKVIREKGLLSLALGLIWGFAVNWCPNVWAEQESGASTDQPRATKNDQGITLKMLIDNVPEIKSIHRSCARDNGASETEPTLSSNVANCMWEEIEKKPALKTSVLETLGLKATPDPNSKQKTGQNKLDPSDKKIEQAFQDPSLANLKEFLFEQYMKALQEDGDRQIWVGHEVFYKLYKAQVENNILSTISNYCLKTTQGLAFTTYNPFPKDNQETNQKIINAIIDYNLERLKDIDPEQIKKEQAKNNKAAEKLQKNQEHTSSAYQDWIGCATHLEHVCYLSEGAIFSYKKDDGEYKITSKDSMFSTRFLEVKLQDKLPQKANLPSKDDDEYTQQQACLITQYLKDLRANLKSINEISAQLNNEHDNGALLTSHEKKKYRYYDEADRSNGIDALTTLTSGELMHDAASDANLEKEVAKIEECLNSSGTLSNQCREILQAYQDQNKEDQATRKLIDRALKEDFIAQANDKDVKRYLASEGYSEEQIKEMASDEAKLQEIKDTIKAKYQNERAALAAALKEQIDQNRRPSTQDKAENKTVEEIEREQLDLIKQELQYRKETYPKIMHYHNVVTSFISVEHTENDKKSKGQNFATLYQELGNNYFARGASAKATPLPDETASAFKQQAEDLKKTVESSGIKDPAQYNAADLSVETVNESFLRHATPAPEENPENSSPSSSAP